MITWFDIFIHHLHSTPSTNIEMSFCIGSACSARPTELVLTETTSHVIAAAILLNSSSTHGAERNIVFIFLCPPCKLFIHCFFTCYIFSVPLIPTFEADLCLTFGTLQHLRSLFSSHMLLAAWFGAISYKRI